MQHHSTNYPSLFADTNSKVCKQCNLVQPLESFRPHASTRDGRHWVCIACWSKVPCTICGLLKKYPDDFYQGQGRQCRSCKYERYKHWYKTPRGKYVIRRHNLKRLFGITPEQYDRLLAKQSGVCAICGRHPDPSEPRRFHVDHCHSTGRVRGILCGQCNSGIGKLKDDPALLERAAAYLRTQ